MVLGNGGYAFFQGLIMILISKMLGVESLGLFSIALALSAPIMIFSNFGMRTLWITDNKKDFEFNDFKVVRVICSIAAMIIVVALGGILYGENNELLIVIFIVSLSKVIENFSDLFYGYYHKKREQKKVAISLLCRSALGVIGIAIGLFFFNNLIVALVFYLLGWLLSFLIFDYDFELDLKTIKKVHFRHIFISGLPLGIALFFINANLMTPRLILNEYNGVEIVGIFTALYFFFQIGSVVINSLGQALLPDLSKYWFDGEKNKHLKLVLFIFVFIVSTCFASSIIFYFLGQGILSIIYGEAVAEYNWVLVLLFLISPLQYIVSFMGHVISSTGKNRSLAVNNILTFLINIVLCLVFIPRFGVYGVLISMGVYNLLALLMALNTYLKSYKEVVYE
jgi:O-antigen/teichoic acid export membrane protein